MQVIQNGGHSPVAWAANDSPAPFARLRSRLIVAGLFVAVVVAVAGLLILVRLPVAVPRVLDSTQITFDEMGKGRLQLHAGKIYFNEQASDRVTLLEVPSVGGTPVLLDSSYPGLFLSGVSADGTKLLVAPASTKDGPFPLKVMDLPSGSLQSVGGIECNEASWAPGGKIIFARDQDVFLSDPDGSNQHKLLSASGLVFDMRFSPDGSTLRFSVGARMTSQSTIWKHKTSGTESSSDSDGNDGFPESLLWRMVTRRPLLLFRDRARWPEQDLGAAGASFLLDQAVCARSPHHGSA